MLGQRGDGQGWIHAKVDGHGRTIDHVEVGVAEHSMAVIAHRAFRIASDDRPTKDVRGRWDVEQGLVDRADGPTPDLFGDPARHIVGDRQVGWVLHSPWRRISEVWWN